MQIGILEPDNFSPDVLAHLATLGNVVCYDGGELASFLAPLEVLFVRLAYRLDEPFLAQMPKLKFLCSPTTGHTHLDESAIDARSIEVISLRGERGFLDSIRATPEHTFGLILALLRRYKEAFTHVDLGGWDRDQLRGCELYGQTVGVIGLGRVGSRVASYCTAFGANVVYSDPNSAIADKEWRRMPDIMAVIRASDIVILCASYINGDPPIIGANEVEALKGRYFVNTARGELVDENALINGIVEDWFPGVATDVISAETGGGKLDAWRSAARGRNIIITPHIGGATISSMARTEAFIAQRLAQRIEQAI